MAAPDPSAERADTGPDAAGLSTSESFMTFAAKLIEPIGVKENVVSV
jgi:hypothetical protein